MKRRPEVVPVVPGFFFKPEPLVLFVFLVSASGAQLRRGRGGDFPSRAAGAPAAARGGPSSAVASSSSSSSGTSPAPVSIHRIRAHPRFFLSKTLFAVPGRFLTPGFHAVFPKLIFRTSVGAGAPAPHGRAPPRAVLVITWIGRRGLALHPVPPAVVDPETPVFDDLPAAAATGVWRASPLRVFGGRGTCVVFIAAPPAAARPGGRAFPSRVVRIRSAVFVKPNSVNVVDVSFLQAVS